MKTIRLFALALAAPAGVAAQEVTLLPPIVVSGGLTPLSDGAYGRAHTVLTREDIEARGAVTLQDALRGVPGLSVSSSGTSTTQVRIRGAEADHTLILVDGVDVSGGSPASYFLSGLSVQNVERVEVLRGPQSVFYGSSASAGVINIITDKGAKGLHYGGSAEVGDGHATSAHVSRRTDGGGLTLNLSQQDDHGYDHTGNGDDDGLRRWAAGLAGDWQPTDAVSFGSTLRWTREEYDFDGFSRADAEGITRSFQGAVWGELAQLGDSLTQRVEYRASIYKQQSDEMAPVRGKGKTLGYRLSYGLDGRSVTDSRHLLNLLLEHQEDRSTAASEYERQRDAVALEYRASLDSGLDLQLGLRRDDNTVFDDFTGWTVGLSWQVPDSPLRIHASAGRAQVDPSYYALFADDAFTVGNPELTPEQNRSVDLGAELSLWGGRGAIDITWFRERMTNAIEYAGIAPDGRSTYVNLDGESPREGVEIGSRLQATDRLGFAANYTYLDARNADGSIAVRRPRHEALVATTFAFDDGRGFTTATVRYVADNYDIAGAGAEKLPDYAALDLTAGYDLTGTVRLTGRVVNLFDKDYIEVRGYASRGRTAYVGVQARW